jgi:hypothetical protein
MRILPEVLKWRWFAVRIPNPKSQFADLFMPSVIDLGFTVETCRAYRI